MATTAKQTELDVPQKRAPYSWTQLSVDWLKHHRWLGLMTNERAESELFAHLLDFFPESDGKRRALVINTDIGDGNYIHELYIENTEKATEARPLPPVKDIVLIHGYAALLGLFLDNFNDLSSVPGIRIHAIDLLGFGFSSRPLFPKLPLDTPEQVEKVEDWFIDAIESWRKLRGIEHFTLMGHSFGGYLLNAYALKYNKPQEDDANLINKLVLISPVGVERLALSIIPKDPEDKDPKGSVDDVWKETKNSRKIKVVKFMWEHNFSPFTVIRNGGITSLKLISSWTAWRFAHYMDSDPEKFKLMHNYIYRVFTAPGLGEYALTRTLGLGALAKLPLIDRVPKSVIKQDLPTLWMYGDKDWMNEKAGEAMVSRINQLANKTLAEYLLVPLAGHHLYLDNPTFFNRKVMDFIMRKV